MKEKLINNLGLKILSIFLAFVVWLIVLNVSNPEVTRTREVPLEIENEQVLLSAGRAYEISGKNTVTVTFDVRTRDDYKVRATDFRAYVDLAELYDVTGSVQVQIEVLNNKDIIANAASKPGVVRVETEEIQSKEFDLAVETVGEPADEYAINDITLTPSQVTLEGPISQVGLISSVGVEVNAEGLSGDTEGTATPIFYDANGNRLTISNKITVSSPEIQYNMIISKVKNVPLDFEVSGNVFPGYQFTGVETDQKNVAVVGLKTNLANLNRITIPSDVLNVNNLTEDKVVTVDVTRYLPEGIQLAESENPNVTLRLKVEPLVNRVISLSEADITRLGAVEGYRYRFIPNRADVTVQGLDEDIQRLQGADLQASVNLTGLEIGTHTVTLEFASAEAFQVVSASELRVDVAEGITGPGMTSAESQENESTQGTSGETETTAGEGTTEETTLEASATVEESTEENN